MLFLLNDTVLNLGADAPKPPAVSSSVPMDAVTRLGAELFAENPGLHRSEIKRAERLAMLIADRAPQINAARFAAPAVGCPVEVVAVSYASLTLDVIAGLARRQQEGGLSLDRVNDMIWNRLAA